MRPVAPLFLSCLLLGSPLAAGNIWTQVWADNGDGAANSLPDSSKWRNDTGGNGWGNSELESYTNRWQNARYDGAGNLVIEARAETYTGSDGITRNYTSGRLLTAATFNQAYGRFEANIKIPYGQGIWPAFWMLGNNIGSVGWPTCGEIDIMENVGYEPNITHGTIHGPGYSGAGGIGAPFDLGAPVHNSFHQFAVEWEPSIIRWYVDGVERVARTPADLPGGSTWVYDHPHFLLLNLAVGGAWPGNPDGSTSFPQQMTVDYVRVYTRDSTQRPYLGAPLPIPGTIQAEDFDDGGPGVAYNDTTVLNQGGLNAFRNSEQVDLEACTDSGGGVDLGWTAPGEWLEYTVNVAAAGPYALSARMASADAGGTFHFRLDGSDLGNSQFTVPNSGGWQAWTSLGPQTVNLPAGQHLLQLRYDTAGPGGGCGNLNWFRFDSQVTPTPLATHSFTRTRTPDPSATRTRTVTLSATRTPSPTLSRTPTRTPSTTPTRTTTRTATRSPSPTATATRTVAQSPSVTATLTQSATRSPSPAGTPTVSPSFSVSPSASPTATQTPSASATASATRSASPSPSVTLSATASATGTGTVSSTPSASPTRSPSATPSPRGSATQSPSATLPLSPSPSPAQTATASATPSPAASPSPSLPGATALPLGVHRILPRYNPQHGGRIRLALQTSGLSQVQVRCYSPAMVLVSQLDLGPQAAGWHALDMPAQGMSPGLYWARLFYLGQPLGPPAKILLLPN